MSSAAGVAAELPSHCFISHAYRAHRAVASLLSILPVHVKPVLFDRRPRDPRTAVSDGIVPAILGCEGLIYLKGGASDRSWWVAFERDYARRAKRAVFVYDVRKKEIRPDTGRPIELNLQMFCHRTKIAFKDCWTVWHGSATSRSAGI